jgi:hypothetical protein
LFSRAFATTLTQVFIITPDASGPEGHEQHYTRILVEAATSRGWPAATVWTADGMAPPAPLPERAALPLRAVNRLRHALSRRRRIAAFRDLFARRGTPNARFILHTATYEDMGLIARGFSLAARRLSVGRLVIVLRYEHYDDEPTRAFIRHALAPAARAPIDLVADSVDLCDLLAPLAPVRIGLARPPVTVRPAARQRAPLFGYFGARRAVKGFSHLPALIAAATAGRRDVKAFVQCYRHPHDEADPATETAFAALKAMAAVELVDAPLSPEDYQDWLQRCAVILIPYDAHHYRAGTSGVFVEAVAAGAAVLTSRGSWMAKEAERNGLTRVLACDWDSGTAGAFAEAALRIGQEAWQPTPDERRWIDAHRPEALLSALIGHSE